MRTSVTVNSKLMESCRVHGRVRMSQRTLASLRTKVRHSAATQFLSASEPADCRDFQSFKESNVRILTNTFRHAKSFKRWVELCARKSLSCYLEVNAFVLQEKSKRVLPCMFLVA